MNKEQNSSSSSIFIRLLFLGSLEFGTAALLILLANSDAKYAISGWYSLSRLSIFSLSLVLAFCLLALTQLTNYRNRIFQKLEFVFQGQSLLRELAFFLLTFLALAVLIIPFETFGRYGLYFERARPLLFLLCLFPAQFSIYWIKCDWKLDWPFLRQASFILSILLGVGGFILFSGLGITSEQGHWNIGGSPLTTLQLIFILLISVLVFTLFGPIKLGLFERAGFLDSLIIFALFIVTIFLWKDGPVPHNEFSTRPAPPYFQVFPTSDARIHDSGSLAILNGAGIFFKEYTDKPLYMVFLAILHFFMQYDYNLLTFIHICVLGLMVPILYILGKSFHSRFFGLTVAGIVLVRQQNAILLSNVFNFNANATQLLTEVPTLLGLIIGTYALFSWIKDAENGSLLRAFIAGGVLGAVSLIRLNPFLLILVVPALLFLVLHKHKKAWLLQSLFFTLGCATLIMPWLVTGKDQNGRSFFIVKFQDIINVRYGPGGYFAPIPSLSTLDQPSASEGVAFPDQLTPLSSGPSLLSIDIHTFPGFVLNHTLHNFVVSFLTLPDSLYQNDQKPTALVQRPYWTLGIEQLTISQIPFIFLNLCLLAIGLAWSWKRWRWAGFVPLFVFTVYSLSLGFGRTSGSRYIVPIDWIIDFYFALGLVCCFQLLPASLQQTLQVEPKVDAVSKVVGAKPSWMMISAVISVFLVASLIPVAQLLIPPRKALCQSVDTSMLTLSEPFRGTAPDTRLVFGEILYPELEKGHFTFTLLTCQQVFPFEIADFKGRLDVGQRIIAGLSGDSKYPHLQLIVLPPEGSNPAKIIWTGVSK